MIGVADGLSYLHSNDVIHGSLKGVGHTRGRDLIPLTLIYQTDILFDGTGVPRITDFGNALISSHQTNDAFTSSYGYSVRWTAPELLEAVNENSRLPTKMSDVYAFAMVVIEVKYRHRSRSSKF